MSTFLWSIDRTEIQSSVSGPVIYWITMADSETTTTAPPAAPAAAAPNQSEADDNEATGNANEAAPAETTSSPPSSTTAAASTTTESTEADPPAPEIPAHVTEAEELYQKLTSASECRSLLRKHLTQAVFDKIKSRKTSLGGTLAHCIRSGHYLERHWTYHVGLTARSMDLPRGAYSQVYGPITWDLQPGLIEKSLLKSVRPSSKESYSQGMLSYSQGMLSYSQGMLSYSQGMVSYSQGMVSYSQGMVSYSQGMVSYSQGMVSYSQGMLSFADDLVLFPNRGNHLLKACALSTA
ncbi:hypothetical protein Btru_077394 [Bulinus truncatus]|nr:hypothetical protein Btru_077394 [Bulinus truncatus]